MNTKEVRPAKRTRLTIAFDRVPAHERHEPSFLVFANEYEALSYRWFTFLASARDIRKGPSHDFRHLLKPKR